MKLAQALSERADLQIRLNELRTRLLLNAKAQEGVPPAEEPSALIEEAERCYETFETLVCRINLTNAATVKDGVTLTGLLAKRDVLGQKVTTMRQFLNVASELAVRGTKSEIATHSTVDVKEMRKKVDAMSKELRELDVAIQELNWTTELL